MNMEFHHYGVTVSDMDKALEFYRDRLGLDVTNQLSLDGEEFRTFVDVENAAADITFLDAGTCAIELLEYTNPDSNDANAGVTSNDTGASHICLAVEDITSVYDDLTTDYEFISPPQTLENGAQVANMYDPDNNVVQIIEE